MKAELRELEGECKLLMNDKLREFGEKCYGAGMREVVEFVGKFELIDEDCRDEWRVQKKKWGITDGD